jgi:RNA polymerase sigma factor (sigma-70 family)
VRRAQEGDGAALADVVARYYPRVRELVRLRLGPGLRRFAESGDVVQEAMGEVVRGLHRFEARDEEAFLRWIARVVENRLRMLARHHHQLKRDAGREVALDPSSPGATGSGADPVLSTLSPLERAAAQEEVQRLRAAILGLEAHYRAVIEARQRGGAWGAIATELGLDSDGAARMLHARALAALTRHLDRDSGRRRG